MYPWQYDRQLGTSDPDPPDDQGKETWIRKECAWCGRYMGMVPGGGVSGTSHGICADCAANEREKLKAAFPDADLEDEEE